MELTNGLNTLSYRTDSAFYEMLNFISANMLNSIVKGNFKDINWVQPNRPTLSFC